MSKSETPDYEVLLKEDSFEIRKYNTFSIVEYEDENDPKMKSGFGSLFKYISDDNKEKEKISMTAPVIQQEDKGIQKMAFISPKEFEGKVPEPNNPKIKVKEFEEGIFAVVQYSGLSTDKKEKKLKKELEAWVLEKEFIKESDFMLAFYNAPFVLPMLRRNEIWLRVSHS